jgi:hypothetical protein
MEVLDMGGLLDTNCIAFNSRVCIAAGPLHTVAIRAKETIDRNSEASVLIFDDSTSALIEVDFRGTNDDILHRLQSRSLAESPLPSDSAGTDVPAGPGRPKLGVVAREVTLLPRHWAWLNLQPGGASVALRKLVEEARKANEGRDRVRQSQEAAYKFMSALAGDLAGFEEATRALFAGNCDAFASNTADWPADVREHSMKLAGPALE